MKIELSSIKHNKMLSRETPAFTATVSINGIERGTVRNSGNGGAIIWQDYDAEREIEKYAATLPPVDFDGLKIPHSAETVIFELLP